MGRKYVWFPVRERAGTAELLNVIKRNRKVGETCIELGKLLGKEEG